MLSFENTEIAFEAKSNRDLFRAYFLFSMVKKPWMVGLGKALVSAALKLRLPVKGLIRKTAFNHFCGGETIQDCQKTIDALAKFGVGTILDYSIEGKNSEKDFDQCTESVIETLALAAQHPEKIPFCVFKPTGIGDFDLWYKQSQGIELSPSETSNWERAVERFETICKQAAELMVPVLVDAEESWIQQSVDDLTHTMMSRYNTGKAIVYNTAQMYRHDRLEFLKEQVAQAQRTGYIYGVKIVRGAYMEKERERAERLGHPSPIQATKGDTDRDYNAALNYCFERLDQVWVCVGTHNEDSSKLAYELLQQQNLASNDPRVCFAQLFGMSDHISFNLAKSGCRVAKYVPYGPVADVMPYLFRRAAENTSVAGQTGRELSLIKKERKRRRKS